VAVALAEIIDKVERIIGEDGNYLSGSQYNTLTTLKPGVGYWIKLSEDVVFKYR